MQKGVIVLVAVFLQEWLRLITVANDHRLRYQEHNDACRHDDY